MNIDYYEKETHLYEREHYLERFRQMSEHIAHLEEKCKMLQRYNGRSNEEILYNMDITVIEKYLRAKKLEQLNNFIDGTQF